MAPSKKEKKKKERKKKRKKEKRHVKHQTLPPWLNTDITQAMLEREKFRKQTSDSAGGGGGGYGGGGETDAPTRLFMKGVRLSVSPLFSPRQIYSL